MAKYNPVSEQQYVASDMRPMTTWAEASQRLADGGTYWLATTRTDGMPHLVPMLAVWVDDALHFAASTSSRKAKNLSRNPHCVISTGAPSLDLVVEGSASKVSDEARLNRVAGAYLSKNDWPVEVREGVFHGEGAPTAEPSPFEVYEVIPTNAFGFGTDKSLGAARWTF